MLKKIVLPIALIFCLASLHAQEARNIKLSIEAGLLPVSESENLGIFLNIEPKLKIVENGFLGLRLGLVINPQSIEFYDPFLFSINEEFDNGGFSFVPTFDYYIHTKNFRPYLGAGIGAYLVTKSIDIFENTSSNRFEANVKNQLGFLFRGGIERNRFRFGIEYNLILKRDIEIPDSPAVGTVDNSYLGLSIGFMILSNKRSY